MGSCGCHPLRTRSPTFSAFPSRRAVPATPVMHAGAYVEHLPGVCCLRLTIRASAITSALRGYLWVHCAFGPSLPQPWGATPWLTSSASPGHLAASRRELGYLSARWLSGWTPFIPLGKRHLVAHQSISRGDPARVAALRVDEITSCNACHSTRRGGE